MQHPHLTTKHEEGQTVLPACYIGETKPTVPPPSKKEEKVETDETKKETTSVGSVEGATSICPEIKEKEKLKALEIFRKAYAFAERTHSDDVRWIKSRASPVTTFNDFFEEYIYVVVASGFKAREASKFAPLLFKCGGQEKEMLKIFNNKLKVKSIANVYAKYSKDERALRALIARGENGLIELPFIGSVTVKHLARNLGVERVAKPDLHMLRFSKNHGFGEGPEAVRDMIKWMSDKIKEEGTADLDVGTTDFVLWIYLMHHGEEKAGCCHGGLRLR